MVLENYKVGRITSFTSDQPIFILQFPITVNYSVQIHSFSHSRLLTLRLEIN